MSSALASSISHATRLVLPYSWRSLSYGQREAVVTYLQMRCDSATLDEFKRGRKIWLEEIPPCDRNAIRQHLRVSHLLKYTTPDHILDTMRYQGLSIKNMWIDEASKIVNSPMLYERPNGGKRMLPSVYGQLKGHTWLRASRVTQDISDMSDGHIEATLNLLKESHGNVVDKSTALLGKMWRHYQNQPEIQKRLEELCLMMQKVEVHEMYPIFKSLAEEQKSRKPESKVWLTGDWGIDDTIKEW